MSDSPSPSEVDDTDSSNFDDSSQVESSWRKSARNYLWDGTRESNFYVGAAMFASGVLLGVGALAFGLYSGTQAIGSEAYWQSRELAFAATLLALPAFIGSDIAIISVSGRTRIAFGIGFPLCILGTGLFIQAYPSQWLVAGDFIGSILTLVIYAVGLMGLTTPRGLALITQDSTSASTLPENDSGIITSAPTERDSESAISGPADPDSEDSPPQPIEDSKSPTSDTEFADLAPNSNSTIPADTEITEAEDIIESPLIDDGDDRAEDNREPHLSLNRARDQLASGDPDQAVTITYTTVREYLLDQLDLSSDSTPTPRELLETCRQKDLNDEIYTPLHDLTETFELVIFGPEPIDRDASEAALTNGERILKSDLTSVT